MPYCPECGEELKEGDKFCSGCGAEIKWEDEAKNDIQPSKSPNSRNWIKYGLLALSLVIGAFILASTVFGPDKIEHSTDAAPVDESSVVEYSVQRGENSEKMDRWFEYSHNCNKENGKLKCDGTISYTGPSDQRIDGGKLLLYCYNEENQCTVGTDTFSTDGMSAERDQRDYTLSCSYGSQDEFTAKLSLTSGLIGTQASC